MDSHNADSTRLTCPWPSANGRDFQDRIREQDARIACRQSKIRSRVDQPDAWIFAAVPGIPSEAPKEETIPGGGNIVDSGKAEMTNGEME